MKPVGAASGFGWLGMKGKQDWVVWIFAIEDSFSHLVPDLDIRRVFPRRPVATQDPNQVLAVFVSVADPLPVIISGLRIEYLWTGSPSVFKQFVAPSREQGNMNSPFGCHINKPIDMLEIGLVEFPFFEIRKR